MYTLITKTGGRQYLQLVESYRNDCGKVCMRVVANLGRLDRIKSNQLDPLIIRYKGVLDLRYKMLILAT